MDSRLRHHIHLVGYVLFLLGTLASGSELDSDLDHSSEEVTKRTVGTPRDSPFDSPWGWGTPRDSPFDSPWGWGTPPSPASPHQSTTAITTATTTTATLTTHNTNSDIDKSVDNTLTFNNTTLAVAVVLGLAAGCLIVFILTIFVRRFHQKPTETGGGPMPLTISPIYSTKTNMNNIESMMSRGPRPQPPSAVACLDVSYSPDAPSNEEGATGYTIATAPAEELNTSVVNNSGTTCYDDSCVIPLYAIPQKGPDDTYIVENDLYENNQNIINTAKERSNSHAIKQ